MQKIGKYRLGDREIDSIELKCLVVSRGLLVDKRVYDACAGIFRLASNPLACNCMLLSDHTIVQITDLGFQLRHLADILSWDELAASEYAKKLGTPFSLTLVEGRPALLYQGEPLDFVTFPPEDGFYRQETASGTPFIGNAVLQGVDWVAFQCLWPCEYAAAGKPCEFCYSGGEFQALTANKRPLPPALPPEDAAEIVDFAFRACGCNSIQLTGGSTFKGERESGYITAYLEAIRERLGAVPGELLLYITPPEELTLIDRYFALGATRVACSIEVWDEERAKIITPGKTDFTTRRRHLEALEYTARRFGPGKAFSNFIIGLEGFDSLREGAVALAQRGIIPSASVWMPMGRPVMGSMEPPDIDFYRRVKELLADLYTRYHLEPAGCCGLNVCVEKDIWRYAVGGACC